MKKSSIFSVGLLAVMTSGAGLQAIVLSNFDFENATSGASLGGPVGTARSTGGVGDGLIEGNRYDRISNIPIVLRNEPDLWRNGLNSENIRILNNTITNSGYVRGREEMGQIHVAFYKMGHELADSRSHRNLTISGNTIENWQDYGIAIRNASGVTITDNLLRSDEENFDNGRRHSAIFIDDSEDVFIEGNRIEDRRPLDAEVEITANTDSVVWVDESKN